MPFLWGLSHRIGNPVGQVQAPPTLHVGAADSPFCCTQTMIPS